MQYYIVDVFAEKKYAGNQLAVFRNRGDSLSSDLMQKIAREINYSETTFIRSDEQVERGYDVRIFTPTEELPFAGHPTLGTVFVIQNEIAKASEAVVLNLKVGKIQVYPDPKLRDVLWMRQREPSFIPNEVSIKEIAGVLGVEQEAIDQRFPIQQVSTGLPFLIVPLKTLESVRRARINRERYLELVERLESRGILVFSPETYSKENHLNVRVFVEHFGVAEDPATGSGNGCLAGYLVKHEYLNCREIELRVEQGYEIGRPSLLFLKAGIEGGDKIRVEVGGKVIMVARGEFI